MARLGVETVGQLLEVTKKEFYDQGGSVVRDLGTLQGMMAPWMRSASKGDEEPLLVEVFPKEFDLLPLSEVFLPERLAESLGPCEVVGELRRHPASTLSFFVGLERDALYDLRWRVKQAFQRFKSSCRQAHSHRVYDPVTTPFAKHVAEEVHLFSPRFSLCLSSWLDLEDAPKGVEGIAGALGITPSAARIVRGEALARLETVTGAFSILRDVLDDVSHVAPMPLEDVQAMPWARGLPEEALATVLRKSASLSIVSSRFGGRFVVPYTSQAWAGVEARLLKTLWAMSPSAPIEAIVSRCVSLQIIRDSGSRERYVAFARHNFVSTDSAKAAPATLSESSEKLIVERCEEILATAEPRSVWGTVNLLGEVYANCEIIAGLNARSFGALLERSGRFEKLGARGWRIVGTKAKEASNRDARKDSQAEQRRIAEVARGEARRERARLAKEKAERRAIADVEAFKAKKARRDLRREERAREDQILLEAKRERKLRRQLIWAEERAARLAREEKTLRVAMASSSILPVPGLVTGNRDAEFFRDDARLFAILRLRAPDAILLVEDDLQHVKATVEEVCSSLGSDLMGIRIDGPRMVVDVEMSPKLDSSFLVNALKGAAEVTMKARHGASAESKKGRFWKRIAVSIGEVD